ncbi:hypothetical protein I4U23_022094 [Adineta vaga]|nr:hypothetical protein I4U23_022094 [Adineta vaga]
MQIESFSERSIRIRDDLSKTRQQNAENLTLIWFDISISENSDAKKYSIFIDEFHHIFNDIHVFNDIDIFIDYITDIKNEYIFLIITNSSSIQTSLEQILNQLRQIHLFYIFYEEKTSNQQELYLEKHKKCRGIFSSMTNICAQLRKDVKICEHNLIGFNVIGNENSTNDEQEANFMYAQLLKEYLLDIANNETSNLTEMIEYCRRKYVDNHQELNRIDELEKNYQNHSSIWWYTRDGFMYKMLNKALRLQDIETLYAMRLFVKELHEQLVYLHHYQQNNSINSSDFNEIILYRGQQMSSNEFLKLKNNQGGLLSINIFLSTSKNRDVAEMFAGNNALLDDNITAVLLKIHARNNDTDMPVFAQIDEISFFGDGENEVLFSMGTVFRIENITQQNSHDDFWLVELTLTNANDLQLTELTRYMREQVQHATPRDRLYNLLLNIGKYTEAKQFLQLALNEVNNSDQQSQAALHHQIGFIYHEMGELEKSITEYEQSLAIKLSYLSDDDPEFALTFANMSGVYRELGQLDVALIYIQQALDIDQRHSNHETILAARFHCMGMILHDQNKIDEAIEQFQKVLTIWIRNLPSTHPTIAESLNNLATIYYEQKRYDQALNMYKKCLDIETKSLLIEHPSLAITYNNIAFTYYHKGFYQDALDYSLKAIELSTRALGEIHPNTQSFQNTLQIIRQKLTSLIENENEDH